ncbi:glycosyltransferase family 2 protein [Streptomyces paromomycinus]|uniref:glycosyltransferase family 2 protein n=1 Tax=Streptomyces paromomycinus TaxID=92743 RepID=UPI0014790361|nr:glycosyltransferase family 2 protein [Streptomyces paromomycinus]
MSGPAARTAAALAWAGAAAVTVRGVGGAVRTAQSLAWLTTVAPAGITAQADASGTRCVLVLPLLREQTIIGEALDHFEKTAAARPGTVLLVVTTAREEAERAGHEQHLPDLAHAVATGASPGRVASRFAGLLPRDQLLALADRCSGRPYAQCAERARQALDALPTTAELAGALCAQARGRGVDVRHLHYPHPHGAMAHQVNYAADRVLAELEPEERRRWWIGLYNADSRPHPDTLAAVAARAADPRTRIVQQSALFTGNLAEMPRGLAGATAAGAAWLQSRWTLAREIPRLHRQAAAARSAGRPVPLAHCVGHGLFVRGDVWTAWGGLPTETMNEDLALSFLACAAGVPIDPLPVLEIGDAPTSPLALIRQQSQWFWSYAQYPAMSRLAAARGLGTPAVRWWLTATGLGRGALWLGQSPAVAATLALPLLHRRAGGSPLSTVATACGAVLALGAYLGLPARALAARAPATNSTRQWGMLPAALVFSAGPWHCLARAAWCRLTGCTARHAKTER